MEDTELETTPEALPQTYCNGDIANIIDNIGKRVLYSITYSKVNKDQAYIDLRNEIKEIINSELEMYKG